MRQNHVLACLLIVTTLRSTPASGCPSEVCMCKWKGGKQTVECGGQYLTKIPEGMDPGTQVLNFSGNSLTVLQNERFKKMELINLQKIYLARNQIIRIHERAFRGLSNLVELDLTDNLIPSVPTDTFQDYTSLMRLSLIGNPIKELKTAAFKHLPFLTTLELSNCYIERIEDEAFMGLDNLEWLRLDGNRITNIVGNHILPSSLHGINLQNNRWTCDCNMIDVHRWLNSFKISQTEDPKCMAPAKLAGQLIKAVPVEELACLPDITPSSHYLEIAEGRNISMFCRIVATPEAIVTWWFQGQVLLNDSFLAPNFHIFYYIEDGATDDEKRTELFIYNTNVDDNGTFSCVAENSAGRTSANYTIRIILKEEPVVEQVILPYEYLLVVLSGAVFISLLLFIVMCIFICKCSRRSRTDGDNKKNPKDIKDASLQLHPGQKCASITNGGSSQDSIIHSKLNGSILFSETSQNDMTLYVANSLQNVSYDTTQSVFSDRCCSPPSARSFQDQNPDLINDAESGSKSRKSDCDKDKMSDVESTGGSNSLPGSSFESNSTHNFPIQPSLVRPSNVHYPPRSGDLARDLYQHQVDVHLNPGYLIDQNGYAVDLSLANMAVMSQQPVNYYRTLPHKRAGGGSGMALRYSNEAEFIFSGQPGPVRYTAEGYPYRPKQNFPSPPEGYKNTAIQQMPNEFCSPQFTTPKWPSCLPGYHPQLQQIKINPPYERISSPQAMLHSPNSATAMPLQPILKKSISAQTTEMDHQNSIPEQEEDEDDDEEQQQCGGKLKHLNGPLADSPDEGYVGDSHESSDL